MHHIEKDLVAPASAITAAMIGQMKMRATAQEAAAMYFEVLKALTQEVANPTVTSASTVRLS